ncbi:excinuclease ABC subunit C, partial [Streptococcus suis]
RSYFRGAHDTKTAALVSVIADFDFIVTDSNIEALWLEINLIQENKPRYNIMLTEDQSYPFILIGKDRDHGVVIRRLLQGEA